MSAEHNGPSVQFLVDPRKLNPKTKTKLMDIAQMMERKFRKDAEERELLLERAHSYFVPGHGPEFNNMDNEEIKTWLEMTDKAFEKAFKEEE